MSLDHSPAPWGDSASEPADPGAEIAASSLDSSQQLARTVHRVATLGSGLLGAGGVVRFGEQVSGV
jgi:hypothetical protein